METTITQQTNVTTPPIIHVVYAGFLRRLMAALIDVGFVTVVLAGGVNIFLTLVVGSLTGNLGSQNPDRQAAEFTYALAQLTTGVLTYAYFVYTTSKWGQTLGKKAMGIKVVMKDTQLTPSFKSSLIREFSKLISLIPIYLGFLWMLWDSQKQTWHDKFAKTVVIKVK